MKKLITVIAFVLIGLTSYSQNLFADYTYDKNVGGSTTGTEISDSGVSPSTGFDILPETGTLLIDTNYNVIGDAGIPFTEFDTYSTTARDGGSIYLDTKKVKVIL